MTKYIITIAIIISSLYCSGQIKVSSGTLEIDTELQIINDQALENINDFKEEMKETYNLASDKFDELRDVFNMDPSDIFMTVELSKLSKKSVDAVANEYKAHKEGGWGEIAKSLGIKPGSDEFHELKAMTKGKSNNGKSNGKGKGASNGKGNSKGKGKK